MKRYRLPSILETVVRHSFTSLILILCLSACGTSPSTQAPTIEPSTTPIPVVLAVNIASGSMLPPFPAASMTPSASPTFTPSPTIPTATPLPTLTFSRTPVPSRTPIPTRTPLPTRTTRPPTRTPRPPTRVPAPKSAPQNRNSVPSGSALLNGGRGITDGSRMNNGNFQVEAYCTRGGYTAQHDGNDWFCQNRSGNRVFSLSIADYDAICRETYGNSRAFVIRSGNSSTRAFNWRCYAYR